MAGSLGFFNLLREDQKAELQNNRHEKRTEHPRKDLYARSAAEKGGTAPFSAKDDRLHQRLLRYPAPRAYRLPFTGGRGGGSSSSRIEFRQLYPAAERRGPTGER